MLKQFPRWWTADVRGLAGIERVLVNAAVAVLAQLAVHAWSGNWRLATWVFVATLICLATIRAVVHILRKRGLIDLDNGAATKSDA